MTKYERQSPPLCAMIRLHDIISGQYSVVARSRTENKDIEQTSRPRSRSALRSHPCRTTAPLKTNHVITLMYALHIEIAWITLFGVGKSNSGNVPIEILVCVFCHPWKGIRMQEFAPLFVRST